MPVEQVSPELERIVSPDQEIEELGRDYQIAEGPIWFREGGYLLFSDIRNSRRMKWSPGEGVSMFRQPTDEANGLTRDPQGRLVACEHATRRVTRLEQDGRVTVVADRYQGKRLNSPNDVVVYSNGSVYFTDPAFPGIVGPAGVDQEFRGVYRADPDGSVVLVASDFEAPNGLALSPDESILYIDDSLRGHVRAFTVQADGSLANGRVFHEFKGELPGLADGMKVDVEGTVYCTGPGGVWVLTSAGKHLGTILTGAEQTTNCAWGGDDWKTLFITTRNTLARISLEVPGVPVPL